jgi:hypothetical protein
MTTATWRGWCAEPFVDKRHARLVKRWTEKYVHDRNSIAMYLRIAILLISISPATLATNYYVAANGNDLVPTPSISTPWQSLAPLAGVTFMPGDTVFLRSGDTFRGTLTINQGGSSLAPLVITAYGSGARPVISGAVEVTGWSSTGAVRTATLGLEAHGLFANGNEQPLARYPDDGQYLWLDSAQTGYLHDNDVAALDPSYLNGSRLCIHTAQWCWEMTGVTTVQGDKVNYSLATQIPAIAGYAYFLFDNVNLISISGEWKYDLPGQTVHYMPPVGIEPAEMLMEASVFNHGIEFAQNASHVKVMGVAFEKQANSGIYIGTSDNRNIEVRNCSFAHQNQHGVQDRGRHNTIADCTFRQVNGIAVYVTGTGGATEVHHNTFKRIGEYRNRGIGTQVNLSAIKAAFVDSCHIHHNDIDTTGYCGISADGGHHTIERNIVRHAMRLNNDGAALKSYGPLTHHTVFRNNFVSESDGNTEGTANGNFFTPGIYFDFQVNNCEISNNTVFDMGGGRGVFLNSGTSDNLVSGNIIHGGDYLIDINGAQSLQVPLTNTTITDNHLFALWPQAFLYRQVDYTNAFNQGLIDGNRLFHPYSPNQIARRMVGNSPVVMDFNDWQAAGNDINGQVGWLDWADNEDYSELFMNQTDDPLTISLNGVLYLDLDSNEVCGSITLQPYTSKILINTGLGCTATETLGQTQGHGLIAYPNPTEGRFILETGESTNAVVLVYDMHGKVIGEHTSVNGRCTIDIGSFAPGVYVLRSGGETLRVVRR